MRQTSGSAGYDLHACIPPPHEPIVLKPMDRTLIPTGIAVVIPTGCYGRIAPRSSFAVKGTSIGAGVVDSDYRGEIKVLLFNHSSEELIISHENRIAQLIIEKIETPEITEVSELPKSTREGGGFGSTGI